MKRRGDEDQMRQALSLLLARQATGTSQIVDNKRGNHFYTDYLTEIKTS